MAGSRFPAGPGLEDPRVGGGSVPRESEGSKPERPPKGRSRTLRETGVRTTRGPYPGSCLDGGEPYDLRMLLGWDPIASQE